MEKDLVGGPLGSVGAYDLAFKDGKLRAEVKAFVGSIGLAAGIVVELEADAVISAIEAAIPGQIDNAVLELLRGALKV